MNTLMSDDCRSARSGRGMVLPVMATFLVATIAVLFLWQPVVWYRFRRDYEQIQATVSRWQSRRPAGIDDQQWRGATYWAGVGIGNVCFSPGHVSLAEMRRLRQDVELADQQPITLETYDWLWARLAETGPKGADYIRRMSELRDEDMGRNVKE